MKRVVIIFTVLLTVLGAASCKSEQNKKRNLQAISGKAGEIEVVTSRENWESDPGNAIRSILAQDCAFLPQKEPLYTLFNVPEQSFNKVFKVHRNILFLTIDKDKSPVFVVHNDVWAQPQTVIRIEAPDQKTAADLILSNNEKLVNVFEKAERDRVLANAHEFEEAQIRTQVADLFGGSPYFPVGYSIKKKTNDFIWISNETTYINQSILIYKYPYEGNIQLTPAFIAEKRNEITHEQIPCTTENSYMIINPLITPGYRMIRYNGRQIAESRGLWDAHNDFMGGPYVSHTFLSKNGEQIIVIDAFVYAPKYPKRNYLRQVEDLLYSFEWKEDFAK